MRSQFNNFDYTQKTTITKKAIIVEGKETKTFSWEDVIWYESNEHYEILMTKDTLIPLKIESFEENGHEEYIKLLHNLEQEWVNS